MEVHPAIIMSASPGRSSSSANFIAPESDVSRNLIVGASRPYFFALRATAEACVNLSGVWLDKLVYFNTNETVRESSVERHRRLSKSELMQGLLDRMDDGKEFTLDGAHALYVRDR